MKNIFLLLLLTFSSIVLFSQSAETLEAKLAEATSSSDKMELKYELAKLYADSKRDKALSYLKDAGSYAVKKKDYFMMANISYLEGVIYENKKDRPRAISRYEAAKDSGLRAGDSQIQIKALDKLGGLQASAGKYKEAYAYMQERSKLGGRPGGSAQLAKAERAITKLINEKATLNNKNRSLEKDKRALKEEVFSLENKMKTGSSTLTPEQKRILEELDEKEKQLEDLASEKARADRKRRELEKKYNELSKEELAQEALLKDAEIEQEKQKNFRNILIGAIGSLVLFALLLFGRLRANRKAKKEIEAKSKEIDAERKRSDELLLNILPTQIAAELKDKGRVKAKKFNDVSVLFTDFKNFSGIAERMTPAQLVDELDHCFKAFDYIIGQYDSIEKIKTIGDAYMCAIGLNSTKFNVEDLIKASLEMQEFMEDYKMDRVRNNKPYFEARIGIHTGPVVAGIVGFNKFAYDIWGDTVNIASRMESNGQVGKVNISESTFNKIRSRFPCEHRGKISAKNKGMIDMYFVKKPYASGMA